MYKSIYEYNIEKAKALQYTCNKYIRLEYIDVLLSRYFPSDQNPNSTILFIFFPVKWKFNKTYDRKEVVPH